MKQFSSLDDAARLSGVMADIRIAMRDAAGAPESEGRKRLADRLNETVQRASKLTEGNILSISPRWTNGWLPPTHRTALHLGPAAFCRATSNVEPFRIAGAGTGPSLMTEEDRKLHDYGAAALEMKVARKRKRRLEEDL